MNNNTVEVGVGVLIYRGGKVLLGERMGSHGAMTWGLPGGHLEYGESFSDCAKREVLEETGLTLNSISEMGFTNDIFEKENKHYVTLFVKGDCKYGEPECLEPLKCKQWKWFPPSELPSSLFIPLSNFVKKYGI
jgi:8-oxo-dGTP diphosphatase